MQPADINRASMSTVVVPSELLGTHNRSATAGREILEF
jgi:hypothetical protein